MEASLFLGVSIAHPDWNQVSANMHRLFDVYLEIQQEPTFVYVGRSIAGPIDREELQLLKDHLQSVLRRMLPPTASMTFSCRAVLRYEEATPHHSKGHHGIVSR